MFMGSTVGLSSGKTNLIAVVFAREVVKMKAVISKKPKSTSGVKSTLVDNPFIY